MKIFLEGAKIIFENNWHCKGSDGMKYYGFFLITIFTGIIAYWISTLPACATDEFVSIINDKAIYQKPIITTPTLKLWHHPRFEERKNEREIMVKTQLSGYFREDIKNKEVLEAMLQVPRHLFVPKNLQNEAYDDNPLPIGYGQTISQPFIVAYMTELLQIKPTDKVLEIGTGSGYQAAILSELTPHVFSIEIIKPLAEKAMKRFSALGYKTIECKRDDGYYGWKEKAPFDAIIVTAAAGHIPPPLIQQLAKGGRMIIPVGGPYQVQNLVLVLKSKNGELKTRNLIPVRFVPLTGLVQKD